MAKKNRSNASEKAAPVVHGEAFATFLKEAQSLGNEVVARRAFAGEVAAYLRAKGFVDDFEAWRKANGSNKPA